MSFMEDSKQLESLKLAENTSFSLPLYQRRPIRSNTYLKLVQLFSICPTNSSKLIGDHVVDLRAESVDEDLINRNRMATTSSISQDKLLRGTSTSVSEENVVFQDVAFKDSVVVPEQDSINLLTDVEEKVAQANCSIENILGEEKQSDDSVVWLVDEQDNLDNVPELHKCGSGSMEPIVEKDFHIDEFCAVLDSFFENDMVVDSSNLEDDIKGRNCSQEQTEPNEFEHLVNLKEMELMKLVSAIDAVNPSCTVTGDEEVEEGEICGEVGNFNGSTDTISNGTVSPDKITAMAVDASQDNAKNKETICISEHEEICGHSMIWIPDDDSTCMKVQDKSLPTQLQYLQPQGYCSDHHLETQVFNSVTVFPETIPPSGSDLRDNANDGQSFPDKPMQDCDGSRKKRKKGPLTEERRAKKKLKSRIKRAEKNRKLGVKRLKLQPVMKPKVVTYCRHYLQGRCYEGEKCKFSHDTTPLTKSKPCGHFARHSCMKGDDCPFDHQLSKYPCNNFATTGFCGRGVDCLFSHEKQITSSSDVLDSNSKPELVRSDEKRHTKVSKPSDGEVFSSQLNRSYSGKSTDSLISPKQVEAKSSNVKDSSVKSILKNVAKPFSKNTIQAPKGISFLSDSKASLVCSDKFEQGEACKKFGDGHVAPHETVLKVPGSNIGTNESSKGVASRKPPGINFLSFVQQSQNDSRSNMIQNLFSTSLDENGKFGKTDISEMKQTGSVPRGGDSFLTNSTTNQAGTSLSLKESQGGENTTMNAISLGKTQADKIVFKDVLSADKEKTTTSCKNPFKASLHSFAGSQAPPASTRTDRHISDAFKATFLSNAPSLVQKAVHSTLSFAANFERNIKPSTSQH